MFLVVDNLPVHRSARVRAWLGDKADRIELCYLPPYAPQLNPDEWLKFGGLGNSLPFRARQCPLGGTRLILARTVLSHFSLPTSAQVLFDSGWNACAAGITALILK